MTFKKFIIRISLLSGIFICSQNVTAVETSVFCSDKDKNWHWLNDGNTKVEGTWGKKRVEVIFYVKYFILDQGAQEYLRLKLQCIQNFGEEFIYAQASDPYSFVWAPFALNDKHILEGHFSMHRSF